MELPTSIYDPDDYSKGPTGRARYLEDRIEELLALREECRSRAERRLFNKRLHSLGQMLDWCKSRAGYCPDL